MGIRSLSIKSACPPNQFGTHLFSEVNVKFTYRPRRIKTLTHACTITNIFEIMRHLMSLRLMIFCTTFEPQTLVAFSIIKPWSQTRDYSDGWVRSAQDCARWMQKLIGISRAYSNVLASATNSRHSSAECNSLWEWIIISALWWQRGKWHCLSVCDSFSGLKTARLGPLIPRTLLHLNVGMETRWASTRRISMGRVACVVIKERHGGNTMLLPNMFCSLI